MVGKAEQRSDGCGLLVGGKLMERPGEVATGTEDCGAAGAVVPVRRGVHLRRPAGQADEQLLDEQAVIDDDRAL